MYFFNFEFSFFLVLLISFIFDFVLINAGIIYSPYIEYFAPLSYPPVKIVTNRRSKRSIEIFKRIKFTAYNTNFDLQLYPDTETFLPEALEDFKEFSREPFLYRGFLKSIPGSEVVGSIIDGIFTGTIRMINETFYIERAIYFYHSTPHEGHISFQLPFIEVPVGNNASSLPFHSIIYKSSDVLDNLNVLSPRNKRSLTSFPTLGSFCGLSNDRIRRSLNYNPSFAELLNDVKNVEKNLTSLPQKSEAVFGSNKVKMGYCLLLMQADPTLWQYFDSELKEEEKSSGVKKSDADHAQSVKEEIAALFYKHVDRATSIFSSTTFSLPTKKDKYVGVRFGIKKMNIMQHDKVCDVKSHKFGRFCHKNLAADKVLDFSSRYNHNDYCQVMTFSYRDYEGGTLGLAYVASNQNRPGGICERHQTNQQSLNTGIITLKNHGKRVPLKNSAITFVHELGHAFGASHDNTSISPDCTPYSATNSPRGNYLMFPYAPVNNRENNDRFSPCSVFSIFHVLDAIKSGNKFNCFEPSHGSFCSNGIVDEGEECDCGDEEECLELGRRSKFGARCCNIFRENSKKTNCKRIEGLLCAPSEKHKCCDSNECAPFNRDKNVICHKETECTEVTKCDGVRSFCPKPKPKPPRTLCNQGTQVCSDGSCDKSFCSLIGSNWTRCEVPFDSNAEIHKNSRLSYLACSDGKTCWSSLDYKISSFPAAYKAELMKHCQPYDNHTNCHVPIILPAGSPCAMGLGYIDVFHKCRTLYADGPLKRLQKLLFSKETFNKLGEWIIEFWWAVTLMSLAAVVLMGLFIKCCSVHTPSTNPSMKEAVRFRDTVTTVATLYRRRPHRNHHRHRRRGDNHTGHDTDTNRAPEYRMRARAMNASRS